MGVRFRRDATVIDEAALGRLAQLAYRGRSLSIGSSRVRRLLQAGERLGMTAGDSILLATETLQEIDKRGEFVPAMEALLDAFDSGRLVTGMREPLHLYLDRAAVAALAVVTCEQCRPKVSVGGGAGSPWPDVQPAVPVQVVEPRRPTIDERTAASVQIDHAGHWPGRTAEGFPELRLDVLAWWPGLDRWTDLTLVASVTQSLAFTGDNFTLLIQQPGDQQPARVNAVWLVKRPELSDPVPVYELRGSSWEPGDEEAHHFRFLVASSSEWCEELHGYLATRWISRGQSPSGPGDFAVPFGQSVPPVSGTDSPTQARIS
jgi:hypothetical protein